jgi:hypothetical protein
MCHYPVSPFKFYLRLQLYYIIRFLKVKIADILRFLLKNPYNFCKVHVKFSVRISNIKLKCHYLSIPKMMLPMITKIDPIVT